MISTSMFACSAGPWWQNIYSRIVEADTITTAYSIIEKDIRSLNLALPEIYVHLWKLQENGLVTEQITRLLHLNGKQFIISDQDLKN